MADYPKGPNRYRIARLADQRLLAFDTQLPRAYLLTPRPANGVYRLSRSGAVTIRNGAIVGIEQPALCSAYSLQEAVPGQFRLTRTVGPSWQIAVGPNASALRPSPKSRTAIVDLLGGGLLLVGEQTASELLVAAAPDGSYRTESAGLVTVRGGARAVTAPAAVVRVGPVYDLAEDFAP